MPRYKVSVDYAATFEIEVDADDAERAEGLAGEVLERRLDGLPRELSQHETVDCEEVPAAA